MIKALIIDDEQHCIQRLERLLHEKLADSIYLTGTATSVAGGISAIVQNAPDLVFLDIQLGNQSGFDLLGQMDKKDFDIIFTTAYDQYAVRAFKFSALDYLLKPIDPNELIQAVAKLSLKKEKHETTVKLDALLHNIKSLNGATKRICVPVVNGVMFLQVSDIIRCKSEINYTTFFLKDSPNLVVAKTLKEYEDMLGEFNFFRVHNSHLVNMAYIKSYNKGKGGYVTMIDNSVIEVSTRRKEEFLKRLAEL
jgi:two-component system LytT family response regulator